FTNIGGSVAAILSLLVISSIVFQRELLGVTLLMSILIMYIIRLRLPESVMWLEAKGRYNQANTELEKYYGAQPENDKLVRPLKLPSLWFRIVIGGIVGWAYTAGFSLIVLTLGPYFFPSLTDWLIFIFGIVAFIAGFIGMVADKFSRKRFLLISAILVVIFAYLFIPTMKLWITDTFIFWFLFIGVSIFINIYFLAEDTLKSEIWPTRRRGLYSAIVRVISLGGSIPVIFLAVNLPIISYMWLGIGIFGTGLVASIAWYIWGTETSKGKSVRIWDEVK
ncbi:MAG TPA: MFS transporter, partial [Ferroplasma sp.]|nr:MFS transporter [Ferroplasma sp.]